MKTGKEQFDLLDEMQQAALLVRANTQHFLDGSPGGKSEAIIQAYAHQFAESPELVTRLTNAYQAKQARSKDPMAVLGSFGF
ncbi:MAG: hypothetical protein P8P30_05470 [Rickettsiales bacterium]|nr:hypothetical protein [Rickettsiales bacterium]